VLIGRKSLPELPRANVLGVGIHAIDLPCAVAIVESTIAEHRKGYVCVASVHGVMEAQRRPEFRRIMNHALLVVPDGMPTVWVGRLQRQRQMQRVFGPDLMSEVCRSSVASGFTHFLYGGQPSVAEQLQTVLQQRFPGIRVVGHYTPPFRPLSRDEEIRLAEKVAETKPDIMWIGLSTPKQEKFMSDYIDRLPCRMMIGVGAAFDFLTGRITDSPVWIKQSGLQWLHRLCQEPGRLWKRYLLNNSQFVIKVSRQLLGFKKYELEPPSPVTSAAESDQRSIWSSIGT
jgi:N-acetylglucosaminyldiphosphoundecaprenol N-acetyl-beta-D-mannosaminyltransferase